jgi:hypothetical protein
VLELAREHGWEPAGTEPPEWTAYTPDGVVDEEATRAERQGYANWGGGYFTNEYQVVSDEDAANIADALECSLDDVPDEGGGVGRLFTNTQWEALQSGELPEEVIDEALERFMERKTTRPPQITPQTPAFYFAGQKDCLREFITFCRAGGFSIG